ncbi:MAG TPA: hypothetical protein VFB62_10005, partial [Polyangiaceae bacterium]|nr:hypothetical protein [Polyangiaceae bacterium]
MTSFWDQVTGLDGPTLLRGFAMAFGFVIVLFLGSMVVPGKRVLGAPLADGQRLPYKLDGLWLFLLLVASIAIGTWAGLSLAVVQRHFVAVWIAANVL